MGAALDYLDGLGQFLASLNARVEYGDHICLAAQPVTPNGTPDTIVDEAVEAGARITGRWATELVEAVDGKTTVGEIRTAMALAAERFDLDAFATLTEREVMRGVMLGSLDDDWELRTGDEVAPATFAAQQSFAGLPFQKAAEFFASKQVLTPAAFNALQDGAKQKAFTVANLAKDELLNAAHAELLKMVREGGSRNADGTPAGGANLGDFKKFAKARLESAGWTPANPSHTETIFRTNIMGAYASGRVAHATQPKVLQLAPYWQIHTVRDDRQRRTHRDAHGIVLLATDPFWLRAYPPWGYNCRCRCIVRTRRWVERTNATIGPVPRGLPDRGFDSGMRNLIQVPEAVRAAPEHRRPEPAPLLPDTRVPQPRRSLQPTPAPVRMPAPRPPEVPPSGDRWTREDFRNRAIQVQEMESLNKAELEVFGRQLSPTEYRALAGGAAFGQEARVFVASFKRQTLVVEVDTSTAGMHRTFVRDGTKTKVKHDLFKVEPEAQGKGVGRAVLKEQVQEYLRLGVSRIELDAAWVGQYTWLRMGFRLAGGFTLDRLRGEFRNWLHQNRLPVALARHPQSARDLAMLTHQGRKLGKEFLLWRGDSGMGLIPLQLDLDPEDNHFRAVAEYLGI